MATVISHEKDDIRPSTFNAKELLHVTDTVVNNLKNSRMSNVVEYEDSIGSKKVTVVKLGYKSKSSASSDAESSFKSNKQTADVEKKLTASAGSNQPAVVVTREPRVSPKTNPSKRQFSAEVISPLSGSPQQPANTDSQKENGRKTLGLGGMLDSGYQTTNFAATQGNVDSDNDNVNNNALYFAAKLTANNQVDERSECSTCTQPEILTISVIEDKNSENEELASVKSDQKEAEILTQNNHHFDVKQVTKTGSQASGRGLKQGVLSNGQDNGMLAKNELQVTQFSVEEKRRVVRQNLLARPHSKVTKKVVHPKIVPSGQAVLSSQQPSVPTAPSDIAVVAAAAAAASAVAATQPLLKADADSRTMQLVEQLTMLLAKQQALNASGAGGGSDGTALARKVASLEEELNRMTQHRLEHLERLQQQQFQLQTELIKIQGRGGHSSDGTVYVARRGDGVDLDREDNIRTLFDTPAPRRAVPQPSVRDQKAKNNGAFLAELLAHEDSALDTPFSLSPQQPARMPVSSTTLPSSYYVSASETENALKQANKLVADLGGLRTELKGAIKDASKLKQDTVYPPLSISTAAVAKSQPPPPPLSSHHHQQQQQPATIVTQPLMSAPPSTATVGPESVLSAASLTLSQQQTAPLDEYMARLKSCPPYSPYPTKAKGKSSTQQSELVDVKAEIEGIRRTRKCFEENLDMVLQTRHDFDTHTDAALVASDKSLADRMRIRKMIDDQIVKASANMEREALVELKRREEEKRTLRLIAERDTDTQPVSAADRRKMTAKQRQELARMAVSDARLSAPKQPPVKAVPKPPKLLDDEATLRRIYGKNYYGARRHTGPSADGAGQKYLPVHVALVKSMSVASAKTQTPNVTPVEKKPVADEVPPLVALSPKPKRHPLPTTITPGMFSAGGQLMPMAIPLGAPRTVGCLQSPVSLPITMAPSPKREKRPASPEKKDTAMQAGDKLNSREKTTEIIDGDLSMEESEAADEAITLPGFHGRTAAYHGPKFPPEEVPPFAPDLASTDILTDADRRRDLLADHARDWIEQELMAKMVMEMAGRRKPELPREEVVEEDVIDEETARGLVKDVLREKINEVVRGMKRRPPTLPPAPRPPTPPPRLVVKETETQMSPPPTPPPVVQAPPPPPPPVVRPPPPPPELKTITTQTPETKETQTVEPVKVVEKKPEAVQVPTPRAPTPPPLPPPRAPTPPPPPPRQRTPSPPKTPVRPSSPSSSETEDTESTVSATNNENVSEGQWLLSMASEGEVRDNPIEPVTNLSDWLRLAAPDDTLADDLDRDAMRSDGEMSFELGRPAVLEILSKLRGQRAGRPATIAPHYSGGLPASNMPQVASAGQISVGELGDEDIAHISHLSASALALADKGQASKSKTPYKQPSSGARLDFSKTVTTPAAGEGSRREVVSHQQQHVSTTVAAATPTHISVVPASSSSAAAGPRRQSVPGGPMATGNKSPVPGVTMSRTGPTQSSAALPGYSANNTLRQTGSTVDFDTGTRTASTDRLSVSQGQGHGGRYQTTSQSESGDYDYEVDRHAGLRGPTGRSSEFVESMQFGSTQASSPGASMVMGRSDDYDRMNAASPVGESDNADSGEEKLSYVPSAAEKPKVSLTIPTVAMDTDFEDIEELSLGN